MQTNITHRINTVEDREIWSLEEVKNYLRVSHTNDDRLIISLLNSAIIAAEQFLGISFLTKKITCTILKAPEYIKAKYLPISAVTRVNIVIGEEQREITADYGYVDFVQHKIWIDPKYQHKKIEILYDAGFGAHLPTTLMHGILMHIGMMYDFGENSTSIASEIREIYMSYRVLKI